MYNPQLTTFISVAESGSFTKAAEALFITPPAVMKQINAFNPYRHVYNDARQIPFGQVGGNPKI